ncbi:MAG: HTH domain-containing protein [bacterium]|nr:HTH domain-containing protein [bacterium]
MAKVERLMQLSNLIKKREAISVKEMSRACGVSQRTIYRYLNTLAKLGTQEFGTEGSSADSRASGSWEGLDGSDLDMIDFCLRQNPLTRLPFFLERLSRVRRKVRARRRHGAAEPSHFVLAEDDHDEVSDSGESEMLERFIRAKVDGRRVTISLDDSQGPPRAMIPRAVKISRGGVALVVSERPGNDVEEIGLTRIKRLVVSAEAVKDNAAV